jgi:hypothetical protein
MRRFLREKRNQQVLAGSEGAGYCGNGTLGHLSFSLVPGNLERRNSRRLPASKQLWRHAIARAATPSTITGGSMTIARRKRSEAL